MHWLKRAAHSFKMKHSINFFQTVCQWHATNGITSKRNLLRAEAVLLKREAKMWLADRGVKVGTKQTITNETANIIVRSPRPVAETGFEDLFHALTTPEQSLVLKRAGYRGDLVWSRTQPLEGSYHTLWPFPVDVTRLQTQGNGSHYRLNQAQVLVWNRAAVFIEQRSLGEFKNCLHLRGQQVRAITQSSDGVVAIFDIEADGFLMWRRGVRDLSSSLTLRGVKHAPISMHELVPISRDSRGFGSLLYLA